MEEIIDKEDIIEMAAEEYVFSKRYAVAGCTGEYIDCFKAGVNYRDGKKVVRDGKVAVLYSPNYGCGWSTDNDKEYRDILLFHPKLVAMVEQGLRSKITEEWMMDEFGLKDICTLGAYRLEIEWVSVGDAFYIKNRDGYESLKFIYYDEQIYVA